MYTHQWCHSIICSNIYTYIQSGDSTLCNGSFHCVAQIQKMRCALALVHLQASSWKWPRQSADPWKKALKHRSNAEWRRNICTIYTYNLKFRSEIKTSTSNSSTPSASPTLARRQHPRIQHRKSHFFRAGIALEWIRNQVVHDGHLLSLSWIYS